MKIIKIPKASTNSNYSLTKKFAGAFDSDEETEKAKKALRDSQEVKEQLDTAIKEFDHFTQRLHAKKAKHRLMQKLTTLDRPSSARLILNFVGQHKTWEVLNELWINALLSNPKTQLVNAIGNGITMIAKPIEDKLGASNLFTKILGWL